MMHVPHAEASRRGASLVEVAMTSLLVGVLLVAALNTVGARLRHQGLLIDRQRAVLLAEQLLAEIMEHDYQEPVDPPTFGPETGESGGTRELFDDVDDFHQWDASPPQGRNGTVLANSTGWRRKIAVEYVDKNSSVTTAVADEGFKRVTVEVYRNEALLQLLSTVRSSAWEFAP